MEGRRRDLGSPRRPRGTGVGTHGPSSPVVRDKAGAAARRRAAERSPTPIKRTSTGYRPEQHAKRGQRADARRERQDKGAAGERQLERPQPAAKATATAEGAQSGATDATANTNARQRNTPEANMGPPSEGATPEQGRARRNARQRNTPDANMESHSERATPERGQARSNARKRYTPDANMGPPSERTAMERGRARGNAGGEASIDAGQRKTGEKGSAGARDPNRASQVDADQPGSKADAAGGQQDTGERGATRQSGQKAIGHLRSGGGSRILISNLLESPPLQS
jgi:hypothetical protein